MLNLNVLTICPKIQQVIEVGKHDRADVVVPPIPSKRRSTPSWSGSERSDPGSPTEKLLSIHGGYKASSQATGDTPSPISCRLGGSPYGNRLGAGSPNRPVATPLPTLSQIVLKTHSPVRPGTDTSRGSTPTSDTSSSTPASAQLKKPRVPPKPKPAIAKKPPVLMSTTTTTSFVGTDQVSLSNDDDELSASPQPALTMPSPDLLLAPSRGPSTTNEPRDGDVNVLLSDDDCSTDAEEWSLTSSLATVDSDD